jgi:glycosyltransferase involved in cell wall biosynthesis
MKVAMITPYHKETTDQLRKCHNSVLAQTYPVTHIMVADGNPHPWCAKQKLEHMVLPESHGDAGATPRAMAAISAFSRGYDAIGFIDADNWIDADHVEQMVASVSASKTNLVVATRRIHGSDGKELYVDTWESNGEDFTDTNCLFLTKSTLHLMTGWITEPGQRLWSDRAFWNVILQSNLSKVTCSKPTVAYVTKWAAHYVNAGVEPSPDSVWIQKDAEGNLTHVKHKDTK